jgi:hypothetical protein
MAPFEVLDGQRSRTPLNWIEPREEVTFGPDIIEEVETTLHCIQENLKVVKSCQETYANKRTLGVRGRRSCILEGLVDEGCKEI